MESNKKIMNFFGKNASSCESNEKLVILFQIISQCGGDVHLE